MLFLGENKYDLISYEKCNILNCNKYKMKLARFKKFFNKNPNIPILKEDSLYNEEKMK